MGFLFNVETIFDNFFNSEEYKDLGSAGERYTYRVLKERFSANEILKNVYINKANGKSTEIDMLAVGKRGIYVIESKNYSGFIFGSEENQKWTQTLNKNTKIQFYNPIKQNETHIKALKEHLNDYPDIAYFNVVVFSERCTLKVDKPNSPNIYVIKRDILQKTLQNIVDTNKETISDNQKREIIKLLSTSSRPKDGVKEQHVQQIKDDLTKCPFCGSELVERENKKTGEKFFGCKGYPKCRYTKKYTE